MRCVYNSHAIECVILRPSVHPVLTDPVIDMYFCGCTLPIYRGKSGVCVCVCVCVRVCVRACVSILHST